MDTGKQTAGGEMQQVAVAVKQGVCGSAGGHRESTAAASTPYRFGSSEHIIMLDTVTLRRYLAVILSLPPTLSVCVSVVEPCYMQWLGDGGLKQMTNKSRRKCRRFHVTGRSSRAWY